MGIHLSGLRFSSSRLRSVSFLVAVSMSGGLTLLDSGPAHAYCMYFGKNITCTVASPATDTNGIQLGPDEDGYTINVRYGGKISTDNLNAISVGNRSTINIEDLVEAYALDSRGLYGQGANTIEGDSFNTVTVRTQGRVLANGPDESAAAIKMMGEGNIITNEGMISSLEGAAIVFDGLANNLTQKNTLINYGSISTSNINYATAIGSSGELGLIIENYGTIDGDIELGDGENDLSFFDGSTVSGRIVTGDGDNRFTFHHNAGLDGYLRVGDGQNTLILTNSGNDKDALNNYLSGLDQISKQGTGRWDLTGDLYDIGNISIERGILGLSGSTSQISGQVVINSNYGNANSDPTATLETATHNLPANTPGAPGKPHTDVLNHGLLRLVQDDDGLYSGTIGGSGKVEKNGDGAVILTGDHTYSGETTINKGTLQLGNGGSGGNIAGNIINKSALVFDRSDDAAYGGSISGDGSVTKNGSGTLSFTGDNIYTGKTTISQGTLQIGDGGVKGSISGDIVNNATLAFNRSDDSSYDGIISGSGNLVKTGTGVLSLNGVNTYTGTTTVTGGFLALSSDQGLGRSGSRVTLNGGGLRFDADGSHLNTGRPFYLGARGGTLDTGVHNVEFGQILSGAGFLTKVGDGVLTLSGANTYTGGTFINEGTLTISADNNLGAATGGLTFGGDGSLRFDAADLDLASTRTVTMAGIGAIDTQAYNGAVSSKIVGDGTLVKRGSGALTLNGANTYKGSTKIEEGELRAGAGGAFSQNSLYELESAGVMNLNGSNQTIGGLSGSGLAMLGGQTLTVDQAVDSIFSGRLDSANGTLAKNGSGGLILSGDWGSANLKVDGSGYLALKKNSALNLTNQLSGSGTLSVDLGGRDLSLNQAGMGTDFKGTLNLENTKLALNGEAANVLHDSNLKLSENSEAVLDADRAIGGLIFDGGTLNVKDNTLSVDNLNLAGEATVQIDTDAISGGSGPTGNIFDYADQASQLAVVKAGQVTGQTGQIKLLDKNGNPVEQSDVVNISGGKAYFSTAATVENSGGLKGLYVGYGLTKVEAEAGQSVGLDSSSATSSDPRLTARLTGSGGFSFSGDQDVKVGHIDSDYTGATTVDGLKVTTTTDKAFGNTSRLELINNGSVDLDGRSLTVGGLSGSAGTEVNLGSASGNTGGLTVNQAADTTFGGNLSGNGSFVKNGGGSLTLSGVNGYAGPTTVLQGRLVAGSAGAFTQNQTWQVNGGQVDLNGYDLSMSQLAGTGGEIQLANNAGLTIDQAIDSAYNGIISGTGELSKTGAGALTLGGANTYSGATNLNGGRLIAGAANAFSSASVFKLANSAVLDLDGFNQTIAGLESGGSNTNVLVAADTALTINNSADHAYGGLVSGSGALIKTGAGQQTLSNSGNTLSGGMEVREGALRLDSAGAAGSGKLAVSSGAKLVLNIDSAQTMSNLISGQGQLSKSGAGSLILSGATVEVGTLEVAAGSLKVQNSLTAGSIITASGAALNTDTLLLSGAMTLDMSQSRGSFSFNRLEVRGAGNRITGSLPSAAGQDLHFQLTSDMTANDVMLSISGQALNIQGARLSLSAGDYLTNLSSNDTVILIDKTTGVIANADQQYQAVYGTTSYYFDVADDPDSLTLGYSGRSNDGNLAKPYLEGILAGLALTADHGRLAAGAISRQIVESTDQSGRGVIFSISGTQTKIKTGSHVDIDGLSVLAGPAWSYDNLYGVTRLGIYIEGGTGDYDSRNSFPIGKVKGKGDISHFGGGAFVRHDYSNGLHIEGSLRMGNLKTDFKTHDLGANASFDTKTSYWGGHAGLGYDYPLSQTTSLQPYFNVYLTRQNSDDAVSDAGERLKIDSADSLSTRLGARLSHVYNETVSFNIGAAWDREYDGEQTGTINGQKIKAPSMEGNSAYGEIGLSIRPRNTTFFVDLNAFGSAKTRQGVGGQATLGLIF